MENGPGLKMYFRVKVGIFQPAMLVYQRVPKSTIQIQCTKLPGRCSRASSRPSRWGAELVRDDVLMVGWSSYPRHNLMMNVWYIYHDFPLLTYIYHFKKTSPNVGDDIPVPLSVDRMNNHDLTNGSFSMDG